MEVHRVAVRALVEFTLHGADITPGGSLRSMLDGTLGHKARQASLGGDWRSEVPLSLRCEVDDDLAVEVIGRMDAFLDGEPPVVEEIKLWEDRTPPDGPAAAHRMQAVCYAHMLCEKEKRPSAAIRVVYVRRSGEPAACFDETLTAAACREEFMGLFLPYLRRLQTVRRHQRARDASLQALAFPYERYRPGQREMAAQVYTAIRLRRRLFAELPTGTGKSAAALFPALKALGAGLTEQVFYLTARTTQRQGPLEALALMRRQPLSLWALTLDAKERQCPQEVMRCDPEHCERAKGHFLRDAEAVEELLGEDDWTVARVREAAEKHCLCPFEFALSLAELADLVICDYNYAFDPAAHIRRIFDRAAPVTLLVDEAHHLQERTRSMLGGMLDAAQLRTFRTAAGKAGSRRDAVYRTLTGLIHALDSLAVPEEEREGCLEQPAAALTEAAGRALEAMLDSREGGPHTVEGFGDILSSLYGFLDAAEREETPSTWLWYGTGKKRCVEILPLDVSAYLRDATKGRRGLICFSATMTPLDDMRDLLGGSEEDACFRLPSPFPPENLLVLARPVNTRYRQREASAPAVAEAIRMVFEAHPGRYLAFFPSFAFLELVSAELGGWPHRKQGRGMKPDEQAAFLEPFRPDGEPVTALAVMGGLFSEGIDLPGTALDGVIIVGVGLPQVGLRQEALRAYWQERSGQGFRYAYQLPGMQKVAQAAGRVIRTETDRGVVLLLDDRFDQRDYRELCPPSWRILHGGREELEAFWRQPISDAMQASKAGVSHSR